MVVLAPEAMAGKNCVCKANGRDYHEGDIACIRGRLSRCEMFLNNTTWKEIADDCPEVKLEAIPSLIARLRKLQGSMPLEAC